ncbi:MAG: tetratricopeptide repeat protein [Bryobacterales bacterium]|nr:tetratricopeptide repeat protein [Bryobacterales bacterium]
MSVRYVYNPQLLSKQDAVAQFIARRRMLARVLDGLRSTHPSHLLFLGTRGMGKTSMLQRIRYAVEDDAELKSRYLALQFPEEQYGVLSLDGFYLNALDALSDALERADSLAASEQLDEQIQRINALPSAGRTQAALEALEASAARLARRLILLTDNAERILDELTDAEQWSFRQTLERSAHLVFFGASTQAIEAQFKRDKAFHEFFQIEWMNPLKPEEVEEILIELGRQQGESARVEKWIADDRARLRTLIRLTGGNPRTIVILFGLVLESSQGVATAETVATELDRLLDAATPAYKGRMEDLPAQSQAVLHGVAENFDPISAAELAAAVRVETTSVSAQLTRLLRMGLVEKTDAEESRVRYQVSERFFNIWYLMRQSRRVRHRLRWLVEFLRIFYDRAELADRASAQAERLGALMGTERARQAEYALAYAEALGDGPGRTGLELSTLRQLLNDDEGRRKIQEIVDFSEVGDPLRSRAERLLALDEARRLVFAAKVDVPGWSAEEFWHELSGSWVVSAEEKREIARQLPQLDGSTLLELRERLKRKFISPKGTTYSFKAFLDLLSSLLRAQRITVLGGFEDARAEARDALANVPLDIVERLDADHGAANSKEAIACAWAELAEDRDRAVELLRAALAAKESVGMWNTLGAVLKDQGRREESESAYRQAIAIDAKYTSAWTGLGNVLWDQGRREESESAYRQAIAIDAKYTHAWNGLGNVLWDQGRHEESESAYRQAIALDAKFTHVWNNLGNMLRDQGRREEAESAYRQAIALDAKFTHAWNGLGNVLSDQGRRKEAESAYRQAIVLDAKFHYALYNLGLLLKGSDATDCFVRAASRNPNDQAYWKRLHPQPEALARAAADALANLPNHPIAATYLAAANARNHGWAAAAPLAAAALPTVSPKQLDAIWWALEQLAIAAVNAREAKALAGLLQSAGFAEPWRPWLVALRAAHNRRTADLKLVAPEYREPAEAILRTIAPDLYG